MLLSDPDVRVTTQFRRRSPVQRKLLVGGVVAAAVVLVLQLVRLLLNSVQQYRRFNLSIDFAIFHQAWYQIAHGNLDPTITANPILTHGAPYWRSHFELIMWPLSLLYWLNRNDGLTLLVLQDVAIVAAEAIALCWMLVLARTRRLPGALVGAAVLVTAMLGALNPWLSSAARQDFHFEALAACFAMGAAYQLWAGHERRCWLFVVLTLSCGDVAGIYLVGIGLAFACTTPRVRRQALQVLGVGFGWVLFVAVIGANQGSPIGAYGYLAVRQPISSGAGGAVAIASGVLVHPSRVLSRVNRSWLQIGRLIGPTGGLGLVNPWTWGVIATTLLVNVLSAIDAFRQPIFQNFPVYLFGTAGTGLLVVLAVGHTVPRQRLAATLLAFALVSGLWFDTGHHEYLVYPATDRSGQELERVRKKTPRDAQVISTFGVVGRLAGREWVDTFAQGGTDVAIHEPVVIVVVAPSTGNQPAGPTVLQDLRTLLVDQLHAHTIWSGATVAAYEWRPGPGVQKLTIPT